MNKQVLSNHLSRLCGSRARPEGVPGNILLVKTHALGDVLMVSPAIQGLRDLYPKAKLTFLTGEWSAPILKEHPALDELVTFPDSDLHQRKPLRLIRLIAQLRKAHYDMALIFHPSPLIHGLVKLAGVPRRIGLDSNGSGFTLTDRVPWQPNTNRYVGDNFFDLVRVLGYASARPAMQVVIPEEVSFEVSSLIPERTSKLVIGVCPGGGRNPRDWVPAKVWPAARYCELLNRLMAEIDATWLLLGGKTDAEVLSTIQAGLKGQATSSSNLGVSELIWTLGQVDLLITNDSAPLHLGIALQKPILALFGPSNSTALIPPDSSVIVVRSKAPCSPCYANSAFPGCPQPFCMDSVTVAEVYDAFVRLLGNSRKQSATGG